MPQHTTQLFELVNALSTQEKKFYRNFDSGESEMKTFHQLFDLYCKNTRDDETEVLTKAAKLFPSKKIERLKEELFHSICEAMCYFQRHDLKVLNAYSQLQKTYFLISKGLQKEASKQAFALKNKLIHSQQRPLIPLLYGIETFLSFQQEEYEAFFSSLAGHQQIIVPLQEFKEMLDTRNYLYASNLLVKKGHRLSQKAKKSGAAFINEYRKEYKAHTQFISPLAALNHLNGVAVDMRLDPKMRLQAAIDQYELVKRNPGTFSIETSLMSLYNVIYIAYHTGAPKTAEAYGKEFSQIEPITLAQKNYKIEVLLTTQLIPLAFQKKYAVILERIEEFEAIQKKKRIRYHESALAFIYQFKVFCNVLSSNAAGNKKIILRFSGNEIKRGQPNLFEVFRILEIINAIELNDFDFVVYPLRNAKLAFKKDKPLLELISILEQIKNSLELNNFSKRDSILKRIDELYKPLFAKDHSHHIFHYFHLGDWAARKMK